MSNRSRSPWAASATDRGLTGLKRLVLAALEAEGCVVVQEQELLLRVSIPESSDLASVLDVDGPALLILKDDYELDELQHDARLIHLIPGSYFLNRLLRYLTTSGHVADLALPALAPEVTPKALQRRLTRSSPSDLDIRVEALGPRSHRAITFHFELHLQVVGSAVSLCSTTLDLASSRTLVDAEPSQLLEAQLTSIALTPDELRTAWRAAAEWVRREAEAQIARFDSANAEAAAEAEAKVVEAKREAVREATRDADGTPEPEINYLLQAADPEAEWDRRVEQVRSRFRAEGASITLVCATRQVRPFAHYRVDVTTEQAPPTTHEISFDCHAGQILMPPCASRPGVDEPTDPDSEDPSEHQPCRGDADGVFGCGCWLCAACTTKCSACSNRTCSRCAARCASCPETLCADHATRCACGNQACPEHKQVCDLHRVQICDSCASTCPACETHWCDQHGTTCETCRNLLDECPGCGITQLSDSCDLCDRSVCNDCLETCSSCDKQVCEHDRFQCSGCKSWLCKEEGGTACGHCKKSACPTCAEECGVCDTAICTSCIEDCEACQTTACLGCLADCPSCKSSRCTNCATECSQCGTSMCVLCTARCAVCPRLCCGDHSSVCSVCEESTCEEHSHCCAVCGDNICPNCAAPCSSCNRMLCLPHGTPCQACASKEVEDHRRSRGLPPIRIVPSFLRRPNSDASEATVRESSAREDPQEDGMLFCRACLKERPADRIVTCDLCTAHACHSCVVQCSRCGEPRCQEHKSYSCCAQEFCEACLHRHFIHHLEHSIPPLEDEWNADGDGDGDLLYPVKSRGDPDATAGGWGGPHI